MERNNFDFSNFDSMSFDPNLGTPDMYSSASAFNPFSQYEQAYMYYRYLSMMMEYKIKCKEYEKLCGNNIRDRKIE